MKRVMGRLLAQLVIQDLAGKVQHLIRLVEDLSLCSVEACLRSVPDMVNRALRKLAEKGMIRVELYQIKILDKEGLKTVAQTIEKLAIVRSSQVGSVTSGFVISVIIFL